MTHRQLTTKGQMGNVFKRLRDLDIQTSSKNNLIPKYPLPNRNDVRDLIERALDSSSGLTANNRRKMAAKGGLPWEKYES